MGGSKNSREPSRAVTRAIPIVLTAQEVRNAYNQRQANYRRQYERKRRMYLRAIITEFERKREQRKRILLHKSARYNTKARHSNYLYPIMKVSMLKKERYRLRNVSLFARWARFARKNGACVLTRFNRQWSGTLVSKTIKKVKERKAKAKERAAKRNKKSTSST